MSYFDKNSDAQGSSASLLRVIAYIFLVFLFTIYSLDFVRSAQLTAFYIPLTFSPASSHNENTSRFKYLALFRVIIDINC